MKTVLRSWLTLLTLLTAVSAQQGHVDWAVEAADVLEKFKIDADWGDYVRTLAPPDDEDATEGTSSSRRPNFDPLDWVPTKYGEVPFLAVLYKIDYVGASAEYKRIFPGEPDPQLGHIEPGKACGGAIITRDALLTVCGCVMTLAARALGSKDFPDLFPKRTIPYDIDSTTDENIIYMTHSIIQFRPDFAHAIGPNGAGWKSPNMPPTLNCKRLFGDEPTKSARANAEVVLANFSPGIRHPLPGQFPSWRPPALPNFGDKDIGFARLNMISIGMQLTTYTKYPFFSSIHASTLVSKFCKVSPENRNKEKGLDAQKYACFCPAYGNKYQLQLIGGVIGWPVIYPNGSLVGLSASDRNSANGSFLVTWLNSEVADDIEQYITKGVLLGQNNLSKTYREKDLDKGFNIYDYGPNALSPKSSAFAPPLISNFLIFVTTMSNV